MRQMVYQVCPVCSGANKDCPKCEGVGITPTAFFINVEDSKPKDEPKHKMEPKHKA